MSNAETERAATQNNAKCSKILVLGATGTVGRLLLDELLRAGCSVRAATRNRAQLPSQFEAVTVDLRDHEGIERALAGIDGLFLATPDMDGQAEVEISVVEAAMRAGVHHITKLSAFRAEEEKYEIGRIHRTVERAIERAGCGWTFLRPSAFMQNFVTYYLQDMRSGLLRLPCGDAPVSFIDARDIAAVAAVSLARPGHAGRAYSMYGPEALSYADATATVSQRLMHPARYENISDEVYRSQLMAGAAADCVVDLYHYYRSGAASGPPIELESVLGRPAYKLAEFASAYGPIIDA